MVYKRINQGGPGRWLAAERAAAASKTKDKLPNKRQQFEETPRGVRAHAARRSMVYMYTKEKEKRRRDGQVKGKEKQGQITQKTPPKGIQIPMRCDSNRSNQNQN